MATYYFNPMRIPLWEGPANWAGLFICLAARQGMQLRMAKVRWNFRRSKNNFS